MAAVKYPSAETIAAIAREAQDAQIGSIDALDTKAGALLALDGLVLTLLFTSEVARSHWNVMLSMGAAALGASTLALLTSLAVREYQRNPNVIAFAPIYVDQPADATNRVIALSIARALAHNQDILKWKVQWVRLGLVRAPFSGVLRGPLRLLRVGHGRTTTL